MKRILSKIAPDSEDFYNIAMPYGVQSYIDNTLQESKEIFDTIAQMIDVNDSVFKKMSELAFKVDEENRCLLSILPRGKVTTEVLQDAVEIDANVWITEQLNSIQVNFVNFELAGLVEVIPIYDAQKDIVIFKMQSIYENDILECEELLPISKFVTKLWYAAGIGITAAFAIASVSVLYYFL